MKTLVLCIFCIFSRIHSELCLEHCKSKETSSKCNRNTEEHTSPIEKKEGMSVKMVSLSHFHGGNFEVISSTSYLERNSRKQPCVNFYFLVRIDRDMTDNDKCFSKIIILPVFWGR